MELVHTRKQETEIVTVIQKQQEHKLFSIKRIKGLKLYSYNAALNELKEVPLEKRVMIGMDMKQVEQNKTSYDPKLIYVQALNRENAAKKIAKKIDDAYCESIMSGELEPANE